MDIGFGIDPRQQLSDPDELALVREAAGMGYSSAWTPAGGDASAFDRCIRWHRESGLATGISVVPASEATPEFYAEHARRAWQQTGGTFTFGVGSGRMAHAAQQMPGYLDRLRALVPDGMPIYVAALGPLMLRLAAEKADGVLLNWCSPERVGWSRARVEAAAAAAGRKPPLLAEYIRTAVHEDPGMAASAMADAVGPYAGASPPYQRHFERMGFAADVAAISGGGSPGEEMLAAVGAHGRPGEVRARFAALAEGLDLAIVRVLVSGEGGLESALRVLQECRPG